LSKLLAKRRVGLAASYLKPRSGRVLDFGCGEGHLAAHVEASRYLGVDVSARAVATARATYPTHTFQVVEETEAWEARVDLGQFDTIVALAVIEHLSNPQQTLCSLRRLTAPGGRVILTTPHPAWERIYRLGARLGLFSSAAAREHHPFLTRSSVEALARGAGLRTVLYRRFLGGANQLFVLAEP
jgi:2-polyprenyl-3-methyl-5-hydroxy-6-metoxy-1,4-benzoquinol methylase